MGHLSCCLGLLPPSFIHISSGESRLFVRFRHLLPFDTVTLSAALPCGGRMCILTRGPLLAIFVQGVICVNNGKATS